MSTGRKSVVAAMLDITSVTEATMIETKRAMTIVGRGLKTSRSFPSHALSPDCCVYMGEVHEYYPVII